ncbi:MAG: iron-sulfur cluster biosynthesis family protein [Rhodoferax sp.]|uniref:iron-sulfur cluster biosynthesis family protein n=1 Tax=Rhodoferax sp. TaxID=50421 RepID=UPI0026033B8C|nr:iron-sulfur cluster biosynthesis family protein [Rhodoferax sp.]MDD2880235.1 iron-sulfur cluster biosynthesis family protein [Rhodoferax sp.]
MFNLTDAAAKQIQQAADASGTSEMALRVAAKKDADGALQYGMGFDHPNEDDMKLDLQGVAVVINGESQALLFDTVLDFVELNPGEFNFIFMHASHPSCGVDTAGSGGCASGGCSSGGCGSKGLTH